MSSVSDDIDLPNNNPKDDHVNLNEISDSDLSSLDIIPGFPTYDVLKHQNKECRFANQTWTEWSDQELKTSLF